MNASVEGSAARLSSAFVVAALSVLTASAQLNPTVKVLPKPQSSVPPECEQGLAPAVPRVIVAEAQPETKPARAVPPPSLDLKTQLRAVQLAAESGNRDAFKAALADARVAVESYPRGGERSAANDVLNVYNDLERLWDYEFTTPTGAFFDSSTDFVSMMRQYPDYARAIADQTLTVNGQTLYPTVETRKFLVAEASKRLANLGVRAPARIVEVPPPPTPVPRPVPRAVPEKPAVRKAERTTPRAAKPHPAPHKAARKPATKRAKPPVKIAQATKPSPRVSQPAPQPAPPPAPMPTKVPAPVPSVAPPPPAPQPTPQPKPVPAPVPSVAPPPPAAQPTTSAAEGRAATTTLPTDTMSKPTTTETTATTATTAPAQTPAPASSGGRMNLLFAIILIIVGIGVLIILFRASD